VALPFLKAYAYLGHRPEDFPNAFYNQSRILSLPLFPEMSDAQRRHVVGAISEFCALKHE
jgi:dTDP-4-amino-4,6-dideoxygalactose transaminase